VAEEEPVDDAGRVGDVDFSVGVDVGACCGFAPGRRPAEEEEAQQVNRIGNVHGLVAVRVAAIGLGGGGIGRCQDDEEDERRERSAAGVTHCGEAHHFERSCTGVA
jgi:hypothetical protein